MTVEFLDIYYAARQPDGELIADIAEVAKPSSIPVVVVCYNEANCSEIISTKHEDPARKTAICHSDIEEVEINNVLFDADSPEAKRVLGLVAEYTPRDAPDLALVLQERMAADILLEIDHDIVSNLRVLQGLEALPHPKYLQEPIKLMSVVKTPKILLP